MSGVLASVDQRTQLVGENRLELLIFKLNSMQLFAINVFKVKEVVKLPRMNKLPGSHSHISGVVNLRGVSIPVIDLRAAIKMPPAKAEAQGDCNLIITEYNRSVQGFMVGEVMHIVNTSWKDILPPPSSAGRSNYLTAITRIDYQEANRIVEIIDVEKVLAEIVSYKVNISEETLDKDVVSLLHGKRVLVVDDSSTARGQVKATLGQLGMEIIEVENGLQALNLLKRWLEQGKSVYDEILLMITDAEMPEMDGYRLTAEVRNDPRMAELFIALNTSLSGSFNQAMVEKVGCNRFISKFQPDLLVDVVQQRMRELIAK
ncbi:chemotaxis protein CheV [Agarivorans gilvus]|jgi:two-component system chemotaxis response regulator CheV|uniref:Chemotaxis protein CheW n=1 Tax=Agarivorans gilvus TaxID=680279 RepID=A0ABQ1I074_9ALTE|nr:chemotaxis protein CheV [Agarivorans gilvus]GGB02230.1 chemotaxis protein CheW [Agarivorans gilvus]